MIAATAVFGRGDASVMAASLRPTSRFRSYGQMSAGARRDRVGAHREDPKTGQKCAIARAHAMGTHRKRGGADAGVSSRRGVDLVVSAAGRGHRVAPGLAGRLAAQTVRRAKRFDLNAIVQERFTFTDAGLFAGLRMAAVAYVATVIAHRTGIKQLEATAGENSPRRMARCRTSVARRSIVAF